MEHSGTSPLVDSLAAPWPPSSDSRWCFPEPVPAGTTLAGGWADLPCCPWALAATVHGRRSCTRGGHSSRPCAAGPQTASLPVRGSKLGEEPAPGFTVTSSAFADWRAEALLRGQGAVPWLRVTMPVGESRTLPVFCLPRGCGKLLCSEECRKQPDVPGSPRGKGVLRSVLSLPNPTTVFPCLCSALPDCCGWWLPRVSVLAGWDSSIF